MTQKLRAIAPYVAFLPLCYGVFIAADDQTVVATVLPDVLTSLKVPATDIDRAAWLIIAFLIGYSATMPVMGRISDRWGYRRAFFVALSIFTIGSALVAISPNIPEWFEDVPVLELDPYRFMIVARVVQSIGAGAVIPIALASAGDIVGFGRRAVAYGMVGASAEAGGVIGPLWGGTINEWIGWEYAFWFNIPLAIIAAVVLLLLPSGKSNPVKVDWLATTIFAFALTASTLALFRISDPDMPMFILGLLSIGAVVLLVLRVSGAGFHDRIPNRLVTWTGDAFTTRSPSLPRYLFAMRDFTYANLAHLLIGAALMIGLVSIPLMSGTVYHLNAFESGLWLMRMMLALGIFAFVGGLITQRYGTRIPTVVGLLCSSIGYIMLAGWQLEVSEPMITVTLVLVGAGFGLVIAPIAENALARVEGHDRGVAAGIVTLSRNVGMTLGLAVIAPLGTAQFIANAPGIAELLVDAGAANQAGLEVFHTFARFAAGACIVGILPAWLMARVKIDAQTEASPA